MARKRLALLMALATIIALLTGCSTNSTAKEDADTITVYLWTTAMYERFAPYIQSQLPDVNIQFVVGKRDAVHVSAYQTPTRQAASNDRSGGL